MRFKKHWHHHHHRHHHREFHRKKQFINMKSIGTIVILIVIAIVILSVIFEDNSDNVVNLPSYSDQNNSNAVTTTNIKISPKCSDGTDYNSCSSNKPFYCLEGNLIEKPEICGCAYEFVWVLNKCVSIYETNPKEIDLNYTLRGKKEDINYTVYRGLNDYLAGLDRKVWYLDYENPPTDEYMELRFITESHQSKYISPLVDKIKQVTDNSDDQARIAISIVQTMPYDWDTYNNQSATGKYPYETLYDQTGVCGDKSKLLALILKELGYGVVLFNFNLESHEAVGIKCPMEYSYQNSGYCFIESTTPSIITDSQGNYVGAGELISIPNIYLVSDGKSMDSVSEEYNDNLTYQKIIAKGTTLRRADYNTWKRITTKYGFVFD